LTEGAEVLQETLEALSNDPQLGSVVGRCLRRGDFFENDGVKYYFEQKRRKAEENIGVEVTLSMANERLGVANMMMMMMMMMMKYNLRLSVNSLKYQDKHPCYLDELPIHAEHSCMEEDWIINVILSKNLTKTRFVPKFYDKK